MKFKPMLAYTVNDLDRIKYPVYVSPKLDGIRAIVRDGVVYSRSMKPVRSKVIQELFGNELYNKLDGELIYGEQSAQDVFNKSTSFCMSKEVPSWMSEKSVKFFIFDNISDRHFQERLVDLASRYRHISKTTGANNVKLVERVLCQNKQEVLVIEEHYLNLGYEGVMLNSPDGLYKQGRSTEKEGYLGKLKRFSDSEAIVIGFEELLHNTNEAKTNELGNTERSSSKEGMVGSNTLGNLLVRDIHSNVEFSIGSGFDSVTRKQIWNDRDSWLGTIVKYKHFAVQSAYEKPRFPIYLGVRDEYDM